MNEKRFSGGIERLRSPERVERLEVTKVVNLCLRDGPYRDMLDLGTGTGLFAEEFSRNGLEITGLDANFAMLAAARSYVPPARFVQAEVEALPFKPASFDLVFFGLVLHEADDPLKVLQLAHLATKKRVCILEWPYTAQSFGPPLAHRLKPDTLEELFQRAGYSSWECKHLKNVDLYKLST